MRIPILSALPPRQLLVVDAAGAALTATTTALLLPWLFGSLGLPAWFFPSFGAAAAGLCLFSTVSVFANRHRASLRVVAVGNLSYLVASVAVTASAWATLSPLWLAYLVGEAVILVTLSSVEWRAGATPG